MKRKPNYPERFAQKLKLDIQWQPRWVFSQSQNALFFSGLLKISLVDICLWVKKGCSEKFVKYKMHFRRLCESWEVVHDVQKSAKKKSLSIWDVHFPWPEHDWVEDSEHIRVELDTKSEDNPNPVYSKMKKKRGKKQIQNRGLDKSFFAVMGQTQMIGLTKDKELRLQDGFPSTRFWAQRGNLSSGEKPHHWPSCWSNCSKMKLLWKLQE